MPKRGEFTLSWPESERRISEAVNDLPGNRKLLRAARYGSFPIGALLERSLEEQETVSRRFFEGLPEGGLVLGALSRYAGTGVSGDVARNLLDLAAQAYGRGYVDLIPGLAKALDNQQAEDTLMAYRRMDYRLSPVLSGITREAQKSVRAARKATRILAHEDVMHALGAYRAPHDWDAVSYILWEGRENGIRAARKLAGTLGNENVANAVNAWDDLPNDVLRTVFFRYREEGRDAAENFADMLSGENLLATARACRARGGMAGGGMYWPRQAVLNAALTGDSEALGMVGATLDAYMGRNRSYGEFVHSAAGAAKDGPEAIRGVCDSYMNDLQTPVTRTPDFVKRAAAYFGKAFGSNIAA